MIKTFACTLAVISVLAGVVGMPVAHADDPLAPIRDRVNRDRASLTGCKPLEYNQVLEDAAQYWVRNGSYAVPSGEGAFNRSRIFTGKGDPEAAAIDDAYRDGAKAMVTDCQYNSFGVGFIRDGDSEVDTVGILFSIHDTPPPPPASLPNTPLVPIPATVQCPAGSPTPTVPSGSTCAEVPPPTNKVSVSFVRGLTWTVNVKNAADIAGKCTYTANGPGGGLGNRTFDIAANGFASFQVPGPLPFATYHVVTSCRGPFNGKDVEFGHDEQDISL